MAYAMRDLPYWLSVSAAMAGIGGSENDAAGLSIGAKAWQEETSLERGDADEMKGDALLWGPTVSLELPERFWLSGTYLQGDMEYDDVDLDEVWKTVTTEIPRLIAILEPLVSEEDDL